MNARRLFRRVLKGLSLYLAAHGSAGCATMPNRFWTDPGRTAMPPKVEQVKPASNDSKPADAVDDSDERHPSRWRQKLRARYS